MKLAASSLFSTEVALCCLVAGSSLLVQGCLRVTSYVDPQLPKVNYAELKVPPNPKPLRINFEFQTNGKQNKNGTKFVQPKLRQTLESSRLFSFLIFTNNAETGGGFHLNLILDNVADVGAAFGKGFGTGLTFGAAGSLVTDGYVFTATLEQEGKEVFNRQYKHAIHTTVGNKKGPEGLEPMSTSEAIDRVLEQLVLNLLKDLQSADRL